jgi:hypothetical protein
VIDQDQVCSLDKRHRCILIPHCSC